VVGSGTNGSQATDCTRRMLYRGGSEGVVGLNDDAYGDLVFAQEVATTVVLADLVAFRQQQPPWLAF